MKRNILPAKADVPEVFDILLECHRDIVDHLDELVSLVSGPQVVAPNEASRAQARNIVEFFSGPAREHNYDEERYVFPVLRACDDAEVKRAAETLCEDHAWIELYWLEIEPQLAAIEAGILVADAAELRAATEFFAGMTRNHMRLEESLLYPKFRDRLEPTQLRAIGREIAARRAGSSR